MVVKKGPKRKLLAKSETAARNERMARAIREMSEPLKEVFDKCANLLNQTDVGQVTANHAVGTYIDEVMSQEERYGANAAGQLADALGKSATWVYNCRRVATTWNKKDIAAIAKRRLPGNKGVLSFDHLVELSQAKLSSKSRDELLEECFQSGLSLKDLKHKIHSTHGKRSNNNGLPKTPVAAASKLAASCDRVLQMAPIWDKVLFDKIDDKAEEFSTPELLAALNKTSEIVDKAYAVLGKVSNSLGAAIATVKDTLSDRTEASKKAAAAKVVKTPAKAKVTKVVRQPAKPASPAKVVKQRVVPVRPAQAVAAAVAPNGHGKPTIVPARPVAQSPLAGAKAVTRTVRRVPAVAGA